MVRDSRISIWLIAAIAACGISLGAAAPSAQAPPRPPPQRSLEVPPIIDPAKTAVLSGLVPTRDPDAGKGGAAKPAPRNGGTGASGSGGGSSAGAGGAPGAGGSAGGDGGAGAGGGSGAGGGAAERNAPVATEVRRSVVWIVKPTAAATPRLPVQTIIVDGGTFAPSTVAVTPGTTVDLRTNEQGVVMVRGEGLLRLERRLTRATNAIPVVPARAGAIDLSLRGAPDSKGLIVCVDSPFQNVATADGSFRIFGVPPGRREVRIRLPSGKVLERTVDLVAGQELVVDWRKTE